MASNRRRRTEAPRDACPGCRCTLLRAISRLLFSISISIPPISVVVRAAEVVAAMGADQLAFVSGEAVRTIGADLAVVIDRGIFGGLDSPRARRTTLWEIAGKFIVENAGSAGEHG